jgi:formamidopyrimidine-DNA glycosylase
MPELPEVETSRRGIHDAVVNHTIERIEIRYPTLRWPIPTELSTCLNQHTINQLTRRGKYLLFHTAPGTLILHLGMSGNLRIVSSDEPAQKHDHVDIVFDQHRLRYHDPRRFGCLLWTQAPPLEHPLLRDLGPEPLSTQFTGAQLHAVCLKRKAAIKNVIMNAKIVVGVGNIYACEALFMAGIRPERPAHSLTQNDCKKLARAIKNVLRKAIKEGGTTLKDFKKADGKPGYFQHALCVYGKHATPCATCKTPITLITLNQRSTFFCAHCQR